MQPLPIWFAYAIERLPLLSSFYEIQYGVAGAFIQLRRNHDKENATRKEIVKAIAGALIHDLLNPLRIVDATVRSVLNLANLALAPFYALKNLLTRKAGKLGAEIAFLPLTEPLWIASKVLLAVGGAFQTYLGRHNPGLSYQALSRIINAFLKLKKERERQLAEPGTRAENEAVTAADPNAPKRKAYLAQLSKIDNFKFFNAQPQNECANGLKEGNLLLLLITTKIYTALGIKAGRLEHLQNQKPLPLAEGRLAKAKTEQEKKSYHKAIRIRTEYAEEDRPNPSLVYGVVDTPYQVVAAAARAIEACVERKQRATLA